jgi:hypothetical protein
MPPAASRAPALLSARVSLIRLWSAVSPPSFPRTFPCAGALFPPRGPSGRFPRFLGTTKHSEFLPPLSRRFVSFASRYRRCALGFAPAGARHHVRGPRVVPRTPQNRFLSTETTGPPRFLENPRYERALLSDPGGTSALGHCRALVLSSAKWTASTPATNTNFGAQSRGPLTHCLRFAEWIAPPPRKTRFRMAGRSFRAGLGYPLGPNERFQVFSSSFPKLHLAHPFHSIEITPDGREPGRREPVRYDAT